MDRIPLAVRFQATLLAVTGAVLVTAPRAAPAFAFAVSALLLAADAGRPRFENWRRLIAEPLIAAIAAFLAFALLSAAWSPVPVDSLSRVGIAVAVFASVLLGALVVVSSSLRANLLMAGWMLVGISLGLLYLIHEVVTNQSFLLWLINTFPELRLPSSMWRVAEQQVVEVHPANLRWNIATANILQWAMLLVIAINWRGRTGWGLSAVVLAGVILVTLLSEDMTSKIAIGIALLVFLVAKFAPKISLRIMMLAWVIAVFGAVPLTSAVTSLVRTHDIDVGTSFGQRLVMWEFVGTQVQKAPVLGLGAASSGSQSVERPKVSEALEEASEPLKRQPLPHPHNLFLQVWYELGLVGAVLFGLIGLAMLRSASQGPPIARPYILAGMAAAMVIASAKWDLWQSWYLAMLGLLLLSWTTAVRLADSAPVLAAEGTTFRKIAFPPALRDLRSAKLLMKAALGIALFGLFAYWAYVLSVRSQVEKAIVALSQCVREASTSDAPQDKQACVAPAEQLAELLSNVDPRYATSGWTPVRVYVHRRNIVSFEPACQSLAKNDQVLRVVVRYPAAESPPSGQQAKSPARFDFTFGAGAPTNTAGQFTYSAPQGCLAIGVIDSPDYELISFGPYDAAKKAFVWRHSIRSRN